jgi:RNA polymerase sigma factor (sigma-70 family)
MSTNGPVISLVAVEPNEEGTEKHIVANVNVVSDEQVHYEQLYGQHYPRVMRLCRVLLADPHEAEDVAQEVFIKLLRASKTETRVMDWEPWLTRVTVNACHDRRRSGWWKWWRAPRPTTDVAASSVQDRPSQRPTPEEEALNREARERIWQAFRALPSRQQEVFVLRYLEGWSTEAVADALGLSVGSVKQHLFRAVHRLRAVIGGGA